MPRSITITKGAQSWTLGDVDCLDAVIAMAARWRQWGYEIAEEAVTPPIAPVTEEHSSMSMRKRIVEFAKVYIGGEVSGVTKADVLGALEATAAKRGMSLNKFAETAEGSALYRLYKSAPGSDVPARPVFKSGYEMLEWERAEHRRKAGIPAEGWRDAPNPELEADMDAAVKAVAQSLVNSGRFSSLTNAARFMRSSPAYAGLFSAAPKYREAVRPMVRG